jgi:hypothetical protein
MGTTGSFTGGKAAGREADYLLPSSAEVKNTWIYTSTPHTPSWRGTQLKHRDNFTFTLYQNMYSKCSYAVSGNWIIVDRNKFAFAVELPFQNAPLPD